MATVKFIIESRPKKDGTNAVMLLFLHKEFRKKISVGINVYATHWLADKGEVSDKHPNSFIINQQLRLYRAAADTVILRHLRSKIDGETIFEQLEAAVFPDRVIAKEEQKRNENSLPSVARRFTAMKKPSTRATYERTVKHIEAFINKGNSDSFDDINKSWLTAFDSYLAPSCPSPNGRALHMRNLRSIINFAIDEEITTNYPFRRFKIKTVRTAKRNLPVEVLREVLRYEVEPWQVVYRDMFALSFMLMGINFADLLHLRSKNLYGGRIEFNRAKTARLYSMKLEPEAEALIEKYAGREYLLNILDTRTDYMQFIRQTNNALRKIGTNCASGKKTTGEALCPDLSTYWARHSWATIASSLDIPKDTIAAALGHGGNTVTDIYIDFDQRKVDAANRKVLDWVLYGKIDGKVVEPQVETMEVEPERRRRGRPRKAA